MAAVLSQHDAGELHTQIWQTFTPWAQPQEIFEMSK